MVLFGSVAENIPMPVIGGLVLVIGVELVIGRLPDIILVTKSAPLSAVAMLITFLATTQLPLQDAILLGAVVSLLLYCVEAVRRTDLVALRRTPTGAWRFVAVPKECPSGAVTVLHYQGVGLFAEVARIEERWPSIENTRDAVIILNVRALPDVPSSVVLKAFENHARVLAAKNCKLMLVGIAPELRRVLDRGGLTAVLGTENVIVGSDEILAALNAAVAHAEQWIAAHTTEK